MKTGSKKRKIRYRLPTAAAIFTALIITIAVLAVSPAVIVLPDFLIAAKAPWTQVVSADWSGEGIVVGHFGDGDPMERYEGWIRGINPPTGPFETVRCVIVYLPPEYDSDRKEAYPILYALHGFGRRPDVWVRSLLTLMDEEIGNGTIPPTVVVMPDFSISGDGSAEGPWPKDGRAGSWYVDSNLGAYEEYFFSELQPWVERTYNIRTDPDGTALLGTSMGGYGVLYYSLVRRDFASAAAAIYPMADLRYAVSGSRLLPYNPGKYSPINRDRPRRAMMTLGSSGLLGVSENFFLYQAFGIDGTDGPWPKEMPVWMRMRSVNPADILESEQPDLSSLSYLLTAGDRDEFNFDDHLPIVEAALKDLGAQVTAEILPELKHGWWGDGNEEYRRKVVLWLGGKLR